MTNPRKGPHPETAARDAQHRDFLRDNAHLNQSELAERLGWTRKMLERFYERNPDIPKNHIRGGFRHRNGSWGGGKRRDKHGYILVRQPDHPYATKAGYVREHRLVMEQMIGRYLEPHEVVHHKNGNKSDNHPENLELLQSNADNLRYAWNGKHHTLETRKKMREAALRVWSQRKGGQSPANHYLSRLDVPRSPRKIAHPQSVRDTGQLPLL